MCANYKLKDICYEDYGFSPQRLGQYKAGGAIASKGWSQVNQDGCQCARAHKISKLPKTVSSFQQRRNTRSGGGNKDPGFLSRQTIGREQAPSTGSKLIPISRTIGGRRNSLPRLRRRPPNSWRSTQRSRLTIMSVPSRNMTDIYARKPHSNASRGATKFIITCNPYQLYLLTELKYLMASSRWTRR
jgi:hypothetical protein